MKTNNDNVPASSFAPLVDRCVRWSLNALRTSDRYNIPKLALAAEQCLHTVLKGPKTYDVQAQMFNDGLSFATLCTLLAEGFSSEIDHAGLKDRLARLCAAHWSNLFNGTSDSNITFRSLVGAVFPEIGFKMLQVIHENKGQQSFYSDTNLVDQLRPVSESPPAGSALLPRVEAQVDRYGRRQDHVQWNI